MPFKLKFETKFPIKKEISENKKSQSIAFFYVADEDANNSSKYLSCADIGKAPKFFKKLIIIF